MLTQLSESDVDEDEKNSRGARSVTASRAGSMVSRSAKSVLGYAPVNKKVLEVSADNVRRWLNFHVLSSTINNFPEDICL